MKRTVLAAIILAAMLTPIVTAADPTLEALYEDFNNFKAGMKAFLEEYISNIEIQNNNDRLFMSKIIELEKRVKELEDELEIRDGLYG